MAQDNDVEQVRKVDRREAADAASARLTTLQATNRSLERHARALSHDLRSPIASTIGGLRLLSQFGDRLAEPERREILDRAIDRLSEMVEHMDALLDEASIDAGGRMAPTDPGLALQWALTTLDRADAERFTTLIDETPRVLGRRVAMRQVIHNIVSNTLRHNPGPVSLHLNAETIDGMVHLHLDDDGAGFPDDIEQLRGEGQSGAGSTGLGLSTIDIAVERMGGRVLLGPSPRGGARVTLVLQPA